PLLFFRSGAKEFRNMTFPPLKTCPYFGPWLGKNDPPCTLPSDYQTDPLKYLPPKVVLSPEELKLADNYANCDFSGGYVRSQIALFRRGPTAEEHQSRREQFRDLKA